MKEFSTAAKVVIPQEYYNRIKTGNDALDKLFDGGLLPGSVITLSAKAGTGKTQFSLQLLEILQANYNVGYVSNEESVEQLAFTSNRINTTNVPICEIKTVYDVRDCIQGRDVLIVDSFSKLEAGNMKARQVEKYALDIIIKHAKLNKCCVILVTHNTKSGQSKGSSLVQHDPDANLYIETVEEQPNLRRIWFEKNRFGCPGEIFLEMTPNGYKMELVKPVTEEEKQEEENTPKSEQRRESIIETMKLLGECSAADISHVTDIEFTKVQNSLRELIMLNLVEKEGRGKDSRYILVEQNKQGYQIIR